jgi:hypothetical protein
MGNSNNTAANPTISSPVDVRDDDYCRFVVFGCRGAGKTTLFDHITHIHSADIIQNLYHVGSTAPQSPTRKLKLVEAPGKDAMLKNIQRDMHDWVDSVAKELPQLRSKGAISEADYQEYADYTRQAIRRLTERSQVTNVKDLQLVLQTMMNIPAARLALQAMENRALKDSLRALRDNPNRIGVSFGDHLRSGKFNPRDRLVRFLQKERAHGIEIVELEDSLSTLNRLQMVDPHCILFLISLYDLCTSSDYLRRLRNLTETYREYISRYLPGCRTLVVFTQVDMLRRFLQGRQGKIVSFEEESKVIREAQINALKCFRPYQTCNFTLDSTLDTDKVRAFCNFLFDWKADISMKST